MRRLIREIYRPIRSLRELYRRLKPHPDHRRKLLSSFTRNARKLAALKARLTLRHEKLVVISLAERMGDIVACEPVSRRVRELHPDAFILWAVRPPYADLLRANPHVDGVLQVHCITEWIWLRRLGLFGRVYDLHVNYRHCTTCLECHMRTDGDPEVNMDNYFNYGSLLGSFSRSAGLPMDEGGPLIYVDGEAKRTVDRLNLPRRYVTIHTTSEDEIKNWDEHKWQKLVDHVVEVYKLGVVEVGLRSFLDRPDDDDYINLCGKCGLLETAEVIRRSVLFIGIDSGPSHLANATKTPGILLLMGKYMWFDHYMPYTGFYTDAAHCRMIRSEGTVADIPLESCLAAVAEIGQLSPEIPGRAPQLGSP